MNTIKKSLLFAGLFCTFEMAEAQNDIDAIRYSQTNIAATARALSMGGAFGALGADFSSLSTNPAGIALYRRSEFTVTPGLQNTIYETDYLGTSSRDNKYNFNLGNLGIVYAYPKENKTEGWKGWGFGIGYNRLNSFHTRNTYEGINKNNSLLDSYVEQANGIGSDLLADETTTSYPFDLSPAYNTYLLENLPGTTDQYFSAIPHGGELQRMTKETRGSNGEVVISFGGNYNDKIFFGVTLGFPYLRYTEDNLYEELDVNKTISADTAIVNDSAYIKDFNFRSFTQAQTLATTGNGFNAKFGLIIRPNDFIRLGAAIHTPTFYSMHDEYQTSFSTDFENGNNYFQTSSLNFYDYNITTPLKAIGSLALIYKQSGLFTLDYEFVDYSTAKLDANDYSFSTENKDIRQLYAQGSNIKAGAEWKYNIFAFRIGGGLFSSVLKKQGNVTTNTDQHKIMYTGGIGIREQNYFVDLGYAYTQGNEAYYPYTLTSGDAPVAISKIKDHRFLLTIGFKF